MRDLAVLFLHLLVTIARLAGPGGVRSVVAESVLVKHQLLILNRSRKRSPNLCHSDRVVAGLCAVFIRPGRLIRSAIVFRPSTLLRLHRALIQRKYRRLFSSNRLPKPGPKGPSQDVIAAVVDMKQRNPSWGCPRIAQQIALAFGYSIGKDVVRRILAARYKPKPDAAGPSWLTVLGHAKDSLWSVDLFRCESAVLHTYWVLVVMDHWTRRIVGFAVHRGVVDGVALCRMFNHASYGQSPPTYLSTDHDPLYRFHQWQANLRILNIREIKTVPYVPRSHPVIERLIGTVRRECLDRLLFWTARAEAGRVPAVLQRASHACGAGRVPAGSEPGPSRRSGDSPVVSVAAALSWAVSHAAGRVTPSSGSACTTATYEFATHTVTILTRANFIVKDFALIDPRQSSSVPRARRRGQSPKSRLFQCGPEL